MVKIDFAGRTFLSKKAFVQYIHSLIYDTLGPTHSVKKYKKQEHFDQLVELMSRHPVFKSVNLSDFAIRRNKMNKSALCVVVKQTGNRRNLTLSWRDAINGKVPNKAAKLETAMRYSVKKQIRDFRRQAINKDSVCAICNGQKNLQVDHDIEFKTLKKAFLKQHKEPVPTQFVTARDGTKRKTFRREDRSFQQAWSRFHKSQAVLRILCRTCNLARNKKQKSEKKIN